MAFEQAGPTDYDVVIIGAGISGINFAYRLQEKAPHLRYAILEGRGEMGGTWSLFKYPGIRSDSDLYTFGFAWRPWESHSSIAEGSLILDYLKESASMYGIDKKIKYNHKVNGSAFSSKDKTWSLDVTANGEQKTIKSNFMLFCSGYYDYNSPLKAAIPGIDNFDGQVIHPQFWPEDLDYENKNVVIIGSGATAITLLPNMADKANQVTMLQRSPSYVMSQPREDAIEKIIRFFWSWCPPVEHRLIRFKWMIIPFLLTRFCYTFPFAARNVFTKLIKKQLPASIAQDPHFNPSYQPFEQRVCLCPGGDFYAALRKGKANIETGVIDTVTSKSIKLASGKELNPDIIVTATGLRLLFGGGVNVSVDGKHIDLSSKYVWKGVMIEDLPNSAFSMGYVDASWTLGADATAQMICRMLNQMKKENTVEVVPRRSEAQRKTMEPAPLLRLTSTYILKSPNGVPKAGSEGQWKARSYYFRDIMTAWFGDIKTNLEWIRAV